MSFLTLTVVIYAKTARRDRTVLWANLEDLTALGLTSTTQYNRVGSMVTRHWVWDPMAALLVTRDHYQLRWFVKDHAAQYSLRDGVGLRVWDQGRLTPWKDSSHGR